MSHIIYQGRVTVGLDASIPDVIEIGDGCLFYISGWYCCLDDQVDKITLHVNGEEIQNSGFSYLRSRKDPYPLPLSSIFFEPTYYSFGFFLPVVSTGRDHIHCSLMFYLSRSGLIPVTLGVSDCVRFFPREEKKWEYCDDLPVKLDHSESPGVVICLATYNPDPDSFRRQVDSIKKQTYTNWICLIHDDNSTEESQRAIQDIISDDQRFFFHSHNENLGFYKNYESLIASVPKTASFVALCDQDDYWYPEKLVRLIGGFSSDTTLVYSDMRVVERDGSVRYDSFWNHSIRSETLMMEIIQNSITGASCMFRRTLCEKILPFPPDIGAFFHEPLVAFHDHWIGCTAMMAGKISFINEPLYNYYQHGENVAGYSPSYSNYQCIFKMLKHLRMRGLSGFFIEYYIKYLTHGAQRECISSILIMRFSDDERFRQAIPDVFRCIQILTSGYRMFRFVMASLVKREYPSDNVLMLFLGYYSGLGLRLLCLFYRLRSKIGFH